MKIRFERSGGFAGIMTNVDIDASALSDEDRQTVRAHIANAEFFALAPEIADASTSGADRFNYRITIESDGRSHTVECTDGSAPATLVPLLDWLNDNARRTPGKPAPQP